MRTRRYAPTTLALLATLALATVPADAQESARFGRFGEVVLYRATPHPSHVVLFVSGDGGWNQGVVDMAKALVSLDTLVVGIDIRTYLASLRKSADACLYPAGDLEALSQYVQKKLDLPRYHVPVLVGYSSGATLVYATLAQAPPNTFRGGISLGFCPDLPVTKPFCKGSGLASHSRAKPPGIVFDPVDEIDSPWITFQGTIDRVCDTKAAARFVASVKGAEFVSLPKVGHGFSVQKNWMPQFRDAFRRLVATTATQRASVPGVAGLPVVEVPAEGGHSRTLAFIASGDGGWASLDRQVASVLASRGVPVVGFDSLQYYWQPHSPEQSAEALERILRHYLAAWNEQRVLLIGYSRGADVLPFMASRLPPDLKQRVELIALVGPAPEVRFEFHYTDWLDIQPRTDALPVVPEVEKLRGMKLLCLYGSDETRSACPRLPAGLASVVALPGGHHFEGDYRAVADRILTAAGHPTRDGQNHPGPSRVRTTVPP